MTTRSVRYRATDIFDAPDDGKRWEVIDGELVVTPPPGWAHQRASGRLFGLLFIHIFANDLGDLVSAPTGVILDEYSGIEPDIIFVSKERRSIIAERGIEGAPDLVVEVLSPGAQHKDRGIKMRRYAAAGVPHYWMLAPRTRSLEAYVLREGVYEPGGTFGPGSVFRPPLFPGLSIVIDDIWK